MEPKLDFTGETLSCRLLNTGVAELCFDRQGESINKFDQATLDELAQALDALEAWPGLQGLLISSGKGVFIVGADIAAFQGIFAQPTEPVVAWTQAAQRLFNRIEDLPCPSVAAVNGYALGGGLELAMTATWRVLAAGAVVGQPEVKLGLIPGFGGTVRLPRLIGLAPALEYISGGGDIAADEAVRLGLAEAVVPPGQLRQTALDLLQARRAPAHWQAARAPKLAPLPPAAPERAAVFVEARRRIQVETQGHYPAPLAAVQVLEQAAGLSRDEALRVEADAFVALGQGPVSGNMTALFFAEQALKRRARSAGKGALPVQRLVVAGAGQMGAGIAALAVERRLHVALLDTATQALEHGMAHIAQRLERAVQRGRLVADAVPGLLAGVRQAGSVEELARKRQGEEAADGLAAAVVVEAVPEELGVKQALLAALEGTLPPEGVLCTNTSTLTLEALTPALKRPERLCGLHFFHPAQGMPLVEVVYGDGTAPDALATAVGLTQRLGKTPVLVRDGPGFLVNRVLAAYLNAFQELLAQGTSPYAIDAAMEAWGWPMGPARLCDAMGLDLVLKASQALGAAFPERMPVRADAAVARLVAAGRHGEAAGLGFYRYVPDATGRSSVAQDAELPALLGRASSDLSAEAIQQRLMLAMTLEALRCLEQQVVGSAAELDMALVLGLGFPAFRGGVLRMAVQTGAAALLAQAQAAGGASGFAPPPLLQAWADGGPSPSSIGR